MHAFVLAILVALSSAQDAREILDQAIEVQQGAKPAQEIRDLYFWCDLIINEGDSTVRIGMKQYYKHAGKRSRDDKIVTMVEEDLNAKEESERIPVQEGWNGSEYWVKDKEVLKVLDQDPVWEETKKGIRERLRMIQTFRRIFFLSNLSNEIRPTRRLESAKGELKIEAVPNDPTSWGVEKLELTFDAKSHLLTKATIIPLEASSEPLLVTPEAPVAPAPVNRLVDEVTHLDFLKYDREISRSGLAVPSTVLVRQEASPRSIQLDILNFEFNQNTPDSRFDPPR